MSFPGRYPALVKSYDPVRRTCQVAIPGLTDGGDGLLEAEIEYPIGDKKTTEIEILPEDPVWVAFLGGDPRYPIITGYRNPQAGNSVDWRRFHHANMAFSADGELTLTAPKIKLAGDVEIAGKTAITGDTLTHNGVNVGHDHKHMKVQTGSNNSGEPDGYTASP